MIEIKTIKEEFIKYADEKDIDSVQESIGEDKMLLMIQILCEKDKLHGIYSDIPDEIYHKCIGLSRSALMLFDKDPIKYHYRYIEGNNNTETTPALEFGKMFHELLLEPDKFDNTYVSDKFAFILGSRNSNKYKDAINTFKFEFPNKKIIQFKDHEQLIEMRKAIRSNDMVRFLLDTPGYIEHTIFWKDPIRKILLKCRLDKLILDTPFDDYKTRNFIIDLKSTLHVFEFESSISKYQYYVQHPWYLDGTKYALGIKDIQLLFIATDKEAPYFSRVGQLDTPSEGLGCKVARDMIDRFSNALQNGFIPKPRVETFNMPDYEYLKQENKKEIRNYE